MDYNPPSVSVHGIFPSKNTIEWVKSLSRVRLFVTPWTVARQSPLSMGFSRQEYWSGLPFPSPGDLSNPRIEPGSPALQADTLCSEPPGNKVGCYFLLQGIFLTQQSNPGLLHYRQFLYSLSHQAGTLTQKGSTNQLDQDKSHCSWKLRPIINYYVANNTLQFSSVTQSCPTLCYPMNRSTPGLPVHHHLPELGTIHQICTIG